MAGKSCGNIWRNDIRSGGRFGLCAALSVLFLFCVVFLGRQETVRAEVSGAGADFEDLFGIPQTKEEFGNGTGVLRTGEESEGVAGTSQVKEEFGNGAEMPRTRAGLENLAEMRQTEEAEEEEVLAKYLAYMERFEQIQTIEDIERQGYEIVRKHVFDIPLNVWLPEKDEKGQLLPAEVVRPESIKTISSEDAVSLQRVPTVRFFTAIESDCHRAAVFLADADGDIVYKCNQLDCNYGVLGRLKQPIKDIVSVAFQDLNKDGRMDIILIAGCQKEEGSYAGKPYKIGEVLFQVRDNEDALEGLDFYRDYRINDKINRFDMNKNAKCIVSFVRDGCSAEFLYTATTEKELTDNGFHVFEEHSYWRNYEKLGQLKVLPGIFAMGDYDLFMIYMINEQGAIVWSFQPMGRYDNLYSLRGMSGKDMDGDGMKDLVVFARYSSEGENGERIMESKCDIYYQRTGGFDIDIAFGESYQCTGHETMEELLAKIREYWGWQESVIFAEDGTGTSEKQTTDFSDNKLRKLK